MSEHTPNNKTLGQQYADDAVRARDDKLIATADAAYEAIRELNHETFGLALPAPLVYDLLGSLRRVGFALDQLSGQLSVGLVRSLAHFEVYDSNGDPKASVELAMNALLMGRRAAVQLAVSMSDAQCAINGQGHTGPKQVRR